jgi:peptidoglycan/LPS O-acetylase OafA/YrhL
MVFLLIVSGYDCFGLLALKASQRLGNISYGIYLLQGLVLNRVFAVEGLRRYALQSTTHYWIILTLSAILLVLAASIAHVLIERPGIALGQALCGRFLAKPSRCDVPA